MELLRWVCSSKCQDGDLLYFSKVSQQFMDTGEWALKQDWLQVFFKGNCGNIGKVIFLAWYGTFYICTFCCLTWNVSWFVLPEPFHASPSQQPSPRYDLIRPKPKSFPGDAGLPNTKPITAKPAASQPITQLAWQQWTGAERAAQLSLLQEERIR